jgi:quinol monooxygenase YgiN
MNLDNRVDTVTCRIDMRFRSETLDSAIELLMSGIGITEATPGCRSCLLARDISDRSRIHYSEEWETEEDLVRRLKSEEFRRVLAAMDMCCSEPLVWIGDLSGQSGFEYLRELRETTNQASQARYRNGHLRTPIHIQEKNHSRNHIHKTTEQENQVQPIIHNSYKLMKAHKTIRSFCLALCFIASFAMLPVQGQEISGTPGSPDATTTIDGKQLPPPPDTAFGGKIERNAIDSTPYWPPRVAPPKGAPNILLIITDDAGYGVTSTFGGVIPTPAMDRIADNGLRYTHFHSTAVC